VRIDIELSGASPRPAPSAEPSEPSKPPRDETTAINALISKYNSALAAQDWPAAITALKAIVAADPTRWDFYEALGNAQFTVGDYQNAAESFDKGIKVAQQFLATSTSNDPIARSDRDRVKAATGQMLINQGNAYLKLKKNDEAIAAYTKAAELVPDPAVAYFNLCVMHYNTGKLEGALDACDKAIAANPNRADAYFIKGSLLVAASKMDKNGKVKAPPGTAETLRKYLELAPQGAHANDVRQLLEYIGAKADSSATSGKRPES
jgi:tetratricopeptide (TPR) repeat protein